MAVWLSSAGDVAAAATALGGLLLVFIGAVSTGFESYSAEHQSDVRTKFLVRGLLALAGFFLALLSAVLALAGKLTEIPCLVVGAVSCLGLSFLTVLITACLSVWDLK